MRPLRLAPLVLVACGSSEPRTTTATQPPLTTPGATHAPTAPPTPPVAARKPVTDTYHGVTVEDPYRWLEGDDADVRAWTDGQNRYTRHVLDALPHRDTLRDEIHAIVTAPNTYFGAFRPAGGKVFALRKQPTKEQGELVVLEPSLDVATARIILDPAAGGDATRTIDWFVPSPDGAKVAVSISTKGTEDGTVHVLDLDGKLVEEPIPDVQRGTGGGDLAWRPDGKGFWYTRYPAAGEKPEEERNFWMQVWFHELGAPRAKDRYELGKEFERIAEIRLETHDDGRVLASVQKGDGGEFQHYVRGAKGWTQLTDWTDRVVFVGFGPGKDLWLVSRAGAPNGKLLRLAPGAKLGKAKVVVPEGKDAIVTDYYDEKGAVVTKDRVYLTYQIGGPTEIRAFTHAGKPAKAPALPPVSLVGGPIDLEDGTLLVFATSYTAPFTRYRYTPKTGALEPQPQLAPPPPVTLDGFEVHREMATSKDGTKVPVNIVWPKEAAKDGSTPCVVTGYGGYGISAEPNFLAAQEPLLKRGFCYVEVNLRGGGEFGEAWHHAGRLTKKQNVFDDFTAALDHVVAQKWSSPERIAILGGSNGGLLMGAIVTQHPDKMKAVVSLVGVYDMLRVETTPNGAYNVPEYGTVKDADQFAAMYAYSPYHRVVEGTRYPAILMPAGENDPRVASWQTRKMVAALQAAQGSDAPILLRTSASAGHGAGTSMSEGIELLADVYAFILWQIGR